ncbi:MAG: sulfotransferase [Spirulina sp. SIO3F2]|nr:sulfotransferase [Spirulina sp. SIO3F2]
MLTTSKHIVMWSIARSRSTVITRAFEQLPNCLVYDEPLSGVYWQNNPHSNYERDTLVRLLSDGNDMEFDFKAIIAQLTGELPPGCAFSFQKHMSHHCLGAPNRDWLKQVNLKRHFFIIRPPQAVILSQLKCMSGNSLPTLETLGYEHHYTLFQEIQDLLGDIPPVINTDRLVAQPETYLRFLCERLGIEFSEQMLAWDAKPQATQLRWTPGTLWSRYYDNVLNSTGFVAKSSEQALPTELVPVMEACLPFYEAMMRYAIEL